jgi:hypothetical protein
MRIWRWLAVLVPGLLASAALPAAANSDLPTLGGQGGGPVRFTCNPGELLVGVGMRYGSWLDWAGPICVGVKPDLGWNGIPRGNVNVPEKKRSFFEDAGAVWASFLPWNLPKTLGPKVVVGTYVPGMGGNGGSFITFAVCPENFYVYGFDATVVGGKNFVARLGLRCRNLGSGAESWVALPAPAPSDLPYYNLTGGNCPAGEAANGIYGRSGVYVDALGLTCGDTPRKPFCQNYANQAVAQVGQATQMECGFGGPRWTPHWSDHFGWCIALGNNQDWPRSEGQGRATELDACRKARLQVAKLRSADQPFLAGSQGTGKVGAKDTLIVTPSTSAVFKNPKLLTAKPLLKGPGAPVTDPGIQSQVVPSTVLKSGGTKSLVLQSLTKTQGTSATGLQPQQLQAAPAIKPLAATAPQVAALPPTTSYDDPKGPKGLPLYVCLTAQGGQCGAPAAQAFCQYKGYAKAGGYDTESQKKAETLSGELCAEKRCKVFERIVCAQ